MSKEYGPNAKKSNAATLEATKKPYRGTIHNNDAVAAKNLAIIQSNLQPNYVPLTIERVEKLAEEGLSKQTIGSMFETDEHHIDNHPHLLEAFNRGRSKIARVIRSELIKDAIEKDNVPVKLYLDKIYSKEDATKKIDVTVSQRPLENIPTESLLEIEIEDSNQQD